MKLLKKLIFLGIGWLISYFLYNYIFVLIFGFIRHALYVSPESLLWLAFYVFMPICILIGAMFIGYFVSGIDNKKIFNASILNPGIFISLESIIPTIRENTYSLYSFVIIQTILWYATGFIGVFLGYLLRRKRDGN